MAARKPPGKRKPSTAQDPPQITLPNIGDAYPSYGYITSLVQERQRLYSTSGVSVNTTGKEREDILKGRSYDQIVREIRRMRMSLLDPVIPAEYRKTSRVMRLGQSLLGDLTIRVPALLCAKPMQVTFQPLDETRESQELATRKEDFIHAVLLGREGERGILDSGSTSVWRDWFDNLFSAGRGGFLLNCRTDRWSKSQADFPRRQRYGDDPEPARGEFPDTPDGDKAFHKARMKRQTGDAKWSKAVKTYKADRAHFPFVLEHVDPLMIHFREDIDGVEDEAIVVAVRPVRETLSRWGLAVAPDGYGGSDILGTGKTGARYLAGPEGVGKAYPLRDITTRNVTLGQGIETVTYFCSAKRAAYLGLLPMQGSGDDADVVESPDEAMRLEDSELYDPNIGVWAQYVDGILVDGGPLPGPVWHPLPLFHSFGLSTAIPDPTFRGIPAVYYLIEACHAFDRIFTMKDQIATWSSWPPMFEESVRGMAGGAVGFTGAQLANPETLGQPKRDISPARLTIVPGGYYEVPDGKTVRYGVLPAEATATLRDYQADLERIFEILGVADVLRGGGGQISGYAEALKMVAARSHFDPIVDNATTTVTRAIQYLLWQLWYRFPEGISVWVGGDPAKGKKKGYVSLSPKDVAPDSDGAGKGTPFLACQVKADPLLPLDEAQLEQRGINALAAKVLDLDTVREEYFRRQAPEKTAARVLADSVVLNPFTQACLVIRAQVRQKILLPELAPLVFANMTGLDLNQAAAQLAYIGALPEETLAELEQQALQAAAAGGPLPGGQSPPGVPGLPGRVQTTTGAAIAPPAPGGGGAVINSSSGGGQAVAQPSTQGRLAAAIA